VCRSGSDPESIAVLLEIEASPGVTFMRYPIDLVTDKHELISFDLDRTDSWQQMEVEHNGRTYRVRGPRAYDKGVKRISRADDCGELRMLAFRVRSSAFRASARPDRPAVGIRPPSAIL
jgi:hypothetical protein